MGLQLIATGLGDLFPASCVAVAVTGWCWARLGRLIAAVYATCFVGAVGASFILKLVANALAPPLSQAGFLSLSQGAPSGHATGAAVVYGGAALLFFRAFKGLGAGLGFLYATSVVAVVSVTRLSLHTHTLPTSPPAFWWASVSRRYWTRRSVCRSGVIRRAEPGSSLH